MYYVYLLKVTNIKDKNFYIGCTSDLRKRMRQHLAGNTKSTKNRAPELLYYEAYSDKYLAFKRGKGLKNSGSVYMALIKRLDSK